MMKRILCAMALAASLVGVTAQPALADTEAHAASVAVSGILGSYMGVLFQTGTSPDCSNSDRGGVCWWWAANAFMALITYAEQNPSSSYDSTIQKDLSDTYTAICGGDPGVCPASANQTGGDPFTVNPATGNHYFDDMGWWEQAWINAYKWTGNSDYLHLAEQIWNYVTNNGWKAGCGGGVIQYVKADGTPGTEDADANSLYLRNSAWLYSITAGQPYSGQYLFGNSSGGGAFADASFIRQHLIYQYNDITLGNSGAYFMIADHPDSSCNPNGKQSWSQAQGEMVNAWTDMYAADKTYCDANPGCSVAPSYYNNLADELARTVIHDQMDSTGNWPFENFGNSGQIEPTVDKGGILSDPCIPTSGNTWPYGCPLGSSTSDYQWYLISKGFFERAIYCSNHNFNDSTLTTFASHNASAIANLPNFGFLWDSSGGNDPVIFATRTSVLDGLDADLGATSTASSRYAMC